MSSTASGSAMRIWRLMMSAYGARKGLVRLATEGRRKNEAFWTRGLITRSRMTIQSPIHDPCTVERRSRPRG